VTLMSQWPTLENDEAPIAYQASEQETSWLLPQSLASLAGEWSAEPKGRHEEQDPAARLRLFTWLRSVSGLDRPH
jgi:hypothetical protein